MKKTFLLATAALLFAAGLFYGCSKKDEPTSVVHDTTTVTVSKTALCYIGDYCGDAILVSDPMADSSQSNVTLSWGGSKTSRVFQDKYVWTGYIVFDWDPDSAWSYYDPSTGYITLYHHFMDTVLTLAITSNVGNCQGTMTLPDSAHINAPSDNDTLPIGPVTCTWTTAARAEWYYVYYSADACSSYYYIGLLEGENMITTGNSITIPASYFNYPGAQYYYVYLSVYPYRGPKPQAGSTGNMTGTIKGFLVGEGRRGDYTRFYVGTPPKNVKTPKMEHKEPSRRERMNKYWKAVTSQ